MNRLSAIATRGRKGQAVSNLGTWLIIIIALLVLIGMYYAWFAAGNENSFLYALLKTITGANPN